jgi:hypothetical protein
MSPRNRIKILSKLKNNSKLIKQAQDAIDSAPEGNGDDVAESIFNKLLNDLSLEDLESKV